MCWRDLLERGDLPNLSRWVIERGGLPPARRFPFDDRRGVHPFLFGRYPGSVGIPAFAGSIGAVPPADGASNGWPRAATAACRAAG